MRKICNNFSSSFTCLICLKTNWFDSYKPRDIEGGAAVLENLWDTSNDLKHSDMKIS